MEPTSASADGTRRANPGARPKAVVCLSGGMDSAVCAALAARDYEPYALHLSYGQRTESRERASAQAVAETLGFKDFLPLRTDLFRIIGGSALTDSAIAVPAAAMDDPALGGAGGRSVIPATYVPFRNANILSAAVSWAEALGAEAVMIGAVEQDSSGYPDCRPVFYRAFQETIRAGTRDGAVRVETPLIAMRKAEIVQLGLELSAPFHVTWSCYSGEERACGVCESCILRLRAFAEAGVDDPVPYATDWKHTDNPPYPRSAPRAGNM